jgi:predicted polyphosphate/ATP-dependent NAD kinase
MSEKKDNESKDSKYNKKRKPILRVEATTADTTEAVKEMDQMKVELINKSGTAKQGVIDMYRFAKVSGYFDK